MASGSITSWQIDGETVEMVADFIFLGSKITADGDCSMKLKDASPGSMHDTGCLGLEHWDDPEGWYGEGGGFRMGNTCIPVADSFQYLAKPIQYCKV